MCATCMVRLDRDQMRKYWDAILGLNYKRSIWIEQEELGEEKAIKLKGKRYLVKIPKEPLNNSAQAWMGRVVPFFGDVQASL